VRLEDAFLCLVLDVAAVPADGVPDLCAAAIAGGADMLRLRGAAAAGREAVARAVTVCRRDDALLVIGGDAALAREVGADGLHLDAADAAIAEARSLLGEGGMVGLSSRTRDEARLAVAVGADYLVHEAGVRCRSDFADLGARAGIPLFAGGIAGVEEAGRMVEAGLLRLCLDAGRLDPAGDLTRQVAAYSRLLGRSF